MSVKGCLVSLEFLGSRLRKYIRYASYLHSYCRCKGWTIPRSFASWHLVSLGHTAELSLYQSTVFSSSSSFLFFFSCAVHVYSNCVMKKRLWIQRSALLFVWFVIGVSNVKPKPLPLFFIFWTTVLSQWDISHGKFGLPSPGKASCDTVALPNLLCMLGVLVFP